MKKIGLALFFLGCNAFLFAQDRTEKLEAFTELKIFNGLNVEIIKYNEARIEISGEKAADVNIKYVKGILKLSIKIHDKFKPKDLKIKVYYNHDILILDANEGSSILSEKTINQNDITIKTQEGAYINVPVKVKDLTIKSVSGGNIKISGTADNQKVEVNSGGLYEAYELITEKANVFSGSGGKAEVNARETLEAKVRFGGNIHYKGNPKNITTKKTMGGIIKNKG